MDKIYRKLSFRWIIILFLSGVLVFGLILFYSVQSSGVSKEYVISNGQIKGYSSFDQLDADSEIILRGKKISIKDTVLEKNEENQVIDFRTISNIKISKIYKDKTKKMFQGESILIQENAVEEGEYVYSLEGYQLMDISEEYLLFLRPSLTEQGVYIIKGVYHGKIPVESSEGAQFKGSTDSIHRLEEIARAAKRKYE